MNQTSISHPQAITVDGHVRLTWLKSTPRFNQDHREKTVDRPWRFRIHRRTETAFQRGEDYAEYFMGGDAVAAEALFDGELLPTNGRKFTWTDDTAALRTTYSYFVEPIAPYPGRCIGPIGVRTVDPEIYWSYERLNQELDSLVEVSGGLARAEPCGWSGGGRPIPCLHVGQKGPRMGLIGLIHPGESGPELIVPALRQLIQTQPELFQSAQVIAIPSVNVDGRQQVADGTPWYVRTTPGGVDLNRNFPAAWETVGLEYGLNTADPQSITYRGTAPGGAHETRAVMDALTRHRPDAVLSYHALASICSLPALVARASADDQAYQQRCRALVEAMGKGLRPGQSYDERWLRPGCSAGSLPLWLYQQFGIPAFDMEFIGDTPDEHPRIAHDLTDRPMLAKYQTRHAEAIGALLRAMI
jgi:hypothetical protein